MLRRSIGLIGRQALRRNTAEEIPCLLHHRCFQSKPPRSATYKRFGERSQARQEVGIPSIAGQNPLIQQLVARARGGNNGRPGSGKKGGASTTVLLVIAGSGGVYYVYHLERVPATGRMRFLDISRKQELEIGVSTTQQTMQQYRSVILPSSDPRVKFVRQTAQRIINALHDSDYASDHLNTGAAADSMHGNDMKYQTTSSDSDVKWEVFVIDDPKTPNAFVTSNGKIFVYTGILPICQDQDGLATVLGHEVSKSSTNIDYNG
jgi:predicted Zn-dependent protease